MRPYHKHKYNKIKQILFLHLNVQKVKYLMKKKKYVNVHKENYLLMDNVVVIHRNHYK